VIVFLLLACGERDRFAGDLALERSLAAIDRDRGGTVEVGELSDPLPDRDGNGRLSIRELRESLDVDPWSVHARELESELLTGPRVRPNKKLARDVDHASQVVVRDVLRFLRRELRGTGGALPSEELILRAAETGRLDSVPAKEAMAMFRDAAIANGTPLPNPTAAAP
jgi:hypothetical protein